MDCRRGKIISGHPAFIRHSGAKRRIALYQQGTDGKLDPLERLSKTLLEEMGSAALETLLLQILSPSSETLLRFVLWTVLLLAERMEMAWGPAVMGEYDIGEKSGANG